MDFCFPMHLVETVIENVLCFRFRMPKEDIGRDDILLYVEYGASPAQNKQVIYNVWAQIRGQSVRAFIHTDSIAGTVDNEDIGQEILSSINNSEDFYETIHRFIEMFGRAEE